MTACNILALLLWALPLFYQSAWAESTKWPKSITVITSDQCPVSEPLATPIGYDGFSPKIRVLNLDAVANIEEKLSMGLPANEAQARQLVEQRIERIGRSQLEADIREAYQAIGVAMKYGVDRYPAIIFDHQAVVFGLTDILAATSFYLLWQDEQQGVKNNE